MSKALERRLHPVTAMSKALERRLHPTAATQ
jgi:hypothetical protein